MSGGAGQRQVSPWRAFTELSQPQSPPGLRGGEEVRAVGVSPMGVSESGREKLFLVKKGACGLPTGRGPGGSWEVAWFVLSGTRRICKFAMTVEGTCQPRKA